MWAKLIAKFGQPVDLEALSAASDEELREAGLSRQKAGYARSLAELVLSRRARPRRSFPRTMRKRSRS